MDMRKIKLLISNLCLDTLDWGMCALDWFYNGAMAYVVSWFTFGWMTFLFSSHVSVVPNYQKLADSLAFCFSLIYLVCKMRVYRK